MKKDIKNTADENNENKDLASCVCFKDCKVVHSTNDGMQILGHFLLTQVASDRNHFYKEWLEQPVDNDLTAGSYFVEKKGDVVYISHLQLEDVVPFYTSKKNMLDILAAWHGYCASDQFSACSIGGKNVIISRGLKDDSDDKDYFMFNANNIH